MHLWSLRLDFACTGQRAVDFTHTCGEDSAGDENYCSVLSSMVARCYPSQMIQIRWVDRKGEGGCQKMD